MSTENKIDQDIESNESSGDESSFITTAAGCFAAFTICYALFNLITGQLGIRFEKMTELARKTRFSTPTRRTIGLNPERLAKDCGGCNHKSGSWEKMLGTSENQKYCLACIKRRTR